MIKSRAIRRDADSSRLICAKILQRRRFTVFMRRFTEARPGRARVLQRTILNLSKSYLKITIY